MDDDTAIRTGRTEIAYVIMLFGLTFIVAAGLLAVLQEPQAALIEQAHGVSSTDASQESIGYIDQAWTWMPLWIGLMGMIMLIGAAVRMQGRA